MGFRLVIDTSEEYDRYLIGRVVIANPATNTNGPCVGVYYKEDKRWPDALRAVHKKNGIVHYNEKYRDCCHTCGRSLHSEAKRLSLIGCSIPCVDCFNCDATKINKCVVWHRDLWVYDYASTFHYLHAYAGHRDKKQTTADYAALFHEIIDLDVGVTRVMARTVLYNLCMFFDVDSFGQYLDFLADCKLPDSYRATVNRSIDAVNAFTTRRMKR